MNVNRQKNILVHSITILLMGVVMCYFNSLKYNSESLNRTLVPCTETNSQCHTAGMINLCCVYKPSNTLHNQPCM